MKANFVPLEREGPGLTCVGQHLQTLLDLIYSARILNDNIFKMRRGEMLSSHIRLYARAPVLLAYSVLPLSPMILRHVCLYMYIMHACIQIAGLGIKSTK